MHIRDVKIFQKQEEKIMMNFEEFKAWVKENITSKDWKETSQIEISVVKKNNGVSATGLFIRESGQDVSPILYLDDYYIHYQTVSCWKMS